MECDRAPVVQVSLTILGRGASLPAPGLSKTQEKPVTVTETSPLSKTDLERIDAYWRAANYLSVGQIYLMDNPLLASRCGRSTSSRACWATGAPPRGST